MPYTVLPSKAVGDVFTSDPMWNTYLRDNLNKGVVRPIAETTLSVAAASIDFTSIAADWSHLLLVLYARGDTAATATAARIRFNGDSGANYDYQQLRGSGASTSASEGLAQTALVVGSVPAASAGANLFGDCEIWLPHYTQAANNKVARSGYGFKIGTASGNVEAGSYHGFWRSNAAVTQVTLTPAAGNFAAGTRATLYGMGGI